jgi:Contact-dependent growth inhibition CdiA C-terminal domain
MPCLSEKAPKHVIFLGMNKILIEKELGAIPSAEEMEVVDILVINKIPKRRIKFLKPNRTKGAKTPDIIIDDDFWEIKSIYKLGKYTLDHAERSGLRQADNLVFDLRKLSTYLQDKAIDAIEKEFLKRKTWKGLIAVVRPGNRCLIFKK